MKTAKIILVALLAVLVGQKSFAQGPGSGREEAPLMDKRDPGKSVSVFPNPATTDYVTIKFESPQAKKVKLNVYTIIGNSVDVETEAIDDFELKIKVRDLGAGYYLLSLNNPESNFKSTLKILKR